jgi:uncharacterized membrane protein
MILMALDHVRDYFHGFHGDPMGPEAGPFLYTTRWITHLCAPIFVLLSGMAAGLVGRKRSKSALSGFLLSRGLWLIFIEITIVTLGWKFNFSNSPGVILQVIWAIGICMVLMSVLVFFSTRVNLVIGLLIIFGHNFIGYMMPESSIPIADPWWMGIERRIFMQLFGINVVVGYPFLAWLGIMALGYGMSPLFNKRATERARLFLRIGVLSVIGFIIIRYTNYYGDTNSWVQGVTITDTIMNFFNVQKYPPSLLYTLVTLGIGMMLLWIIESVRLPLHDQIVTIGRVPFFYYIIHIYLIHGSSVISGVAMGYQWSDMMNLFRAYPSDFGFNLVIVYLVWIGVVVALYPACKWFAGVKERTKAWYLSYL